MVKAAAGRGLPMQRLDLRNPARSVLNQARKADLYGHKRREVLLVMFQHAEIAIPSAAGRRRYAPSRSNYGSAIDPQHWPTGTTGSSPSSPFPDIADAGLLPATSTSAKSGRRLG